MFKIYVFVYDISLQNVFIGSVLNKKKISLQYLGCILLELTLVSEISIYPN